MYKLIHHADTPSSAIYEFTITNKNGKVKNGAFLFTNVVPTGSYDCYLYAERHSGSNALTVPGLGSAQMYGDVPIWKSDTLETNCTLLASLQPIGFATVAQAYLGFFFFDGATAKTVTMLDNNVYVKVDNGLYKYYVYDGTYYYRAPVEKLTELDYDYVIHSNRVRCTLLYIDSSKLKYHLSSNTEGIIVGCKEEIFVDGATTTKTYNHQGTNLYPFYESAFHGGR